MKYSTIAILLCVAACGPAGPAQVDGSLVDIDAETPDAGFDETWPRAWQAPIPLGAINTEYDDAHPTVTADLLQICWSSTRPGGLGGHDIWCAYRGSTAEPFGSAVNQASINSESTEWMATLSADGSEMIFSSWRDENLFDLYRATWNDGLGAYNPPEQIAALNTEAWETGPELSSDGLTLYFDTAHDEYPGFKGGSDLMVATRGALGVPFGAPTVAATINSEVGEQEATISPGKTAIAFCSTREEPMVPRDYLFGIWGSFLADGSWTQPTALLLDDWDGRGGCGPEFLHNGSLLFHSTGDSGEGNDIFLAAPWWDPIY